jgi:hypothetical protein
MQPALFLLTSLFTYVHLKKEFPMLANAHSAKTATATPQDLRLTSSFYCEDEARLFSDQPFKVHAIGICTLRSKPVKGGKHRLTVQAETHLSDAVGNAPVYAE